MLQRLVSYNLSGTVICALPFEKKSLCNGQPLLLVRFVNVVRLPPFLISALLVYNMPAVFSDHVYLQQIVFNPQEV